MFANLPNISAVLFLSTPSARRATHRKHRYHPCKCISIHALREEGDRGGGQTKGGGRISIHALREEGDPMRVPPAFVALAISIHALREEGDWLRCARTTARPNFYPRPPRGGRPIEGDKTYESVKFLSTPSARRATYFLESSVCSQAFLSTPSARRATALSTSFPLSFFNFYPRPPRGGRPEPRPEP